MSRPDFVDWLRGKYEVPTTPVEPLMFVSLDKLEGLGESVQEERTTTPQAMEKLEKLYRTDPVTYRIVEEYKSGLITDFVFESEGHQSDVEFCKKWARDISLNVKYLNLVQDIVLTGNGWTELILDSVYPYVKLRVINPKTMDYIRDPSTGKVMLDDEQNPIGFEQKYITSTGAGGGVTKIEWYKNKILKNGLTIINSSNSEDLRKRISHHKLWWFGDSYIGTTPLIAAYKSAIIRLNISDSVGEGAFRGGGLWAVVPKATSEDSKIRLRTELKNLTTKNLIITEDGVVLNTIPTADLANREKLFYTYADEMCSGMMTFMPLLMSPPGLDVSRGVRDEMSIRFEMYLETLRDVLAVQVRDQVLDRLWEVAKKKGSLPYVRLADRAQIAMLNLSRVISTLARRDLIRRDPELELAFRESMGLPVKYVKEEMDKWDKEGISSAPSGIGGNPFGQKGVDTTKFPKPNGEEDTKGKGKVDKANQSTGSDNPKKSEEDEE